LARVIGDSELSCWPTARAEDSESCGNHPEATDSLTGAKKLWPTLVANDDNEFSTAVRNWSTPRSQDYKQGANRPEANQFNLADQAETQWSEWKREEMLEVGEHTCDQCGTVSMHNMMEPCPTCKKITSGTVTYRSSLPDPATRDGQASSQEPPGSRRRLNAIFVAWLMGWPVWWVAPAPMPCAALEMVSYRSRLRWHLLSFFGK
jgi:hypothetical protein